MNEDDDSLTPQGGVSSFISFSEEQGLGGALFADDDIRYSPSFFLHRDEIQDPTPEDDDFSLRIVDLSDPSYPPPRPSSAESIAALAFSIGSTVGVELASLSDFDLQRRQGLSIRANSTSQAIFASSVWNYWSLLKSFKYSCRLALGGRCSLAAFEAGTLCWMARL